MSLHTPLCIKLGNDFDDYECDLRLIRLKAWKPRGSAHCQACSDGVGRIPGHNAACRRIQEQFNADDRLRGFVMPRNIIGRGRKVSSSAQ